MAAVGQEISMTVFLRANQEPFPGAGIWAFTRENAEVLREQIQALQQDTSLSAAEKDYEALADVHGTLLGRTNANGKLYHTFTDESGYLLMAFYRGYLPGSSSIHVYSPVRALAIEAPRRAPVGEPVTITVHQRSTTDPVAGAGVWALSRDNVAALQEQMAVLREDTSTSAEEKDYEAVVSLHGTLLGHTGPNGQLTHTFTEAGGYLLVAVKRGYVPGWAGIHIGDMPQALAIWAPMQAPLGREITMAVFLRSDITPVADADVWALSRENAQTLQEQLKLQREEATTSAAETDYEAVVSIYGTLLGHTGPDGRLSHTFTEAGSYLLVAVKRGYIPGYTPIRIVDPTQLEPATEPSPQASATQ